MPTQLSLQNPRLARVRELQTVRGRQEQSRFAVEGPTLLAEALAAGLSLRELYATPAALEPLDVRHFETAGIPCFVVPERGFARISDLETPGGVLAVFDLPRHTAGEVLAAPGLMLLLAGVSDPGNAGTLVRSAEAFGAGGVLFGRGGADPFAPKVVRAAMGSLFRLPVAGVRAEEVIAEAEATGRPLVATTLDGEDLRTAGIPANAILAVGNERRGVRDWLPRWDRAVRIPQRAATESLNAAVAGSIALYEAARCQDPCQAAENP